MSAGSIIDIIVRILAILGISYFIYVRVKVRSSRKKVTAKANKGMAAIQNSGQVAQAPNRGQIVQDHRQFYSNGITFIININNPNFNLDSPLPDNLKKNLMHNISKVGHKYQVPEEKIKVAQEIIGDSTGSFGDISTAFLPVSGSFARASESSQEKILFDILRLTDLENYINYEVRPTWKCQHCGHINSLKQASCEKCNALKE